MNMKYLFAGLLALAALASATQAPEAKRLRTAENEGSASSTASESRVEVLQVSGQSYSIPATANTTAGEVKDTLETHHGLRSAEHDLWGTPREVKDPEALILSSDAKVAEYQDLTVLQGTSNRWDPELLTFSSTLKSAAIETDGKTLQRGLTKSTRGPVAIGEKVQIVSDMGKPHGEEDNDFNSAVNEGLCGLPSEFKGYADASASDEEDKEGPFRRQLGDRPEEWTEAVRVEGGYKLGDKVVTDTIKKMNGEKVPLTDGMVERSELRTAVVGDWFNLSDYATASAMDVAGGSIGDAPTVSDRPVVAFRIRKAHAGGPNLGRRRARDGPDPRKDENGKFRDGRDLFSTEFHEKRVRKRKDKWYREEAAGFWKAGDADDRLSDAQALALIPQEAQAEDGFDFEELKNDEDTLNESFPGLKLKWTCTSATSGDRRLMQYESAIGVWEWTKNIVTELAEENEVELDMEALKYEEPQDAYDMEEYWCNSDDEDYNEDYARVPEPEQIQDAKRWGWENEDSPWDWAVKAVEQIADAMEVELPPRAYGDEEERPDGHWELNGEKVSPNKAASHVGWGNPNKLRVLRGDPDMKHDGLRWRETDTGERDSVPVESAKAEHDSGSESEHEYEFSEEWVEKVRALEKEGQTELAAFEALDDEASSHVDEDSDHEEAIPSKWEWLRTCIELLTEHRNLSSGDMKVLEQIPDSDLESDNEGGEGTGNYGADANFAALGWCGDKHYRFNEEHPDFQKYKDPDNARDWEEEPLFESVWFGVVPSGYDFSADPPKEVLDVSCSLLELSESRRSAGASGQARDNPWFAVGDPKKGVVKVEVDGRKVRYSILHSTEYHILDGSKGLITIEKEIPASWERVALAVTMRTGFVNHSSPEAQEKARCRSSELHTCESRRNPHVSECPMRHGGYPHETWTSEWGRLVDREGLRRHHPVSVTLV